MPWMHDPWSRQVKNCRHLIQIFNCFLGFDDDGHEDIVIHPVQEVVIILSISRGAKRSDATHSGWWITGCANDRFDIGTRPHHRHNHPHVDLLSDLQWIGLCYANDWSRHRRSTCCHQHPFDTFDADGAVLVLRLV